MNFRRAYAIERDAEGKPYRMVWLGDYKRIPVVYETCPKCPGSPRLRNGRCFSCWGNWSGITKEVRV